MLRGDKLENSVEDKVTQITHKLCSSLIDRIEKIESLLVGHELGDRNLVNEINHLKDRIIDTERDMNFVPTFDYVNEQILPFIRNLIFRMEKLEKLEPSFCEKKDNENFNECIIEVKKDYKSKICELWKRIDKLDNLFYKEINHNTSEKFPYTCPVCDGLGGTVISGVIDCLCKACDGKCIVWN